MAKDAKRPMTTLLDQFDELEGKWKWERAERLKSQDVAERLGAALDKLDAEHAETKRAYESLQRAANDIDEAKDAALTTLITASDALLKAIVERRQEHCLTPGVDICICTHCANEAASLEDEPTHNPDNACGALVVALAKAREVADG